VSGTPLRVASGADDLTGARQPPALFAGDGDEEIRDERFAFGLQLMIDGLLNTEPPQV
jgi:hypothetical protein